MEKQVFSRAGVLAGFFFCLAVFPASIAQAADAAQLERAQALLQAGETEAAYRLFFALFREDPGDDIASAGLARTAFLAGRPNQSIMAYERLIAKYPGEATLYREIAQVYLSIGDKESARYYLQNDPSIGKDGAAAAAARLGERYERLQVHGRLRAGLLYDSNANQGPASGNLNLGNWTVQVDDAEKIGTFGAYLGGAADLGYRLEKNGNWWVVGDAAFFARESQDSDLRRMDKGFSQYYRLAAGMRYLSSDRLFDLRLKGDLFDYDFVQTVHSEGPELTFIQSVHPKVQLITRGGFERRNYINSSGYTGNYGRIGEYARIFLGEDSHELTVGGSYSGGNAKNEDYSYNGWEGFASLRFKLPYNVELTPSVSYAVEKYDGPATVLELEDRKDKRLRLGLGVLYRIDESWGIEASYQYTHNNSNSDLYEYRRHFLTVGAVWSF